MQKKTKTSGSKIQPSRIASFSAKFTRFTLFRWLPVEIEGLENLPNKPFILAANHVSFLDSVLICALIIPARNIVPLVWHTYFGFPLSIFMKSVNAIPIEKDGLSLEKLKKVISILRTTSILIFPEGRRASVPNIDSIKGGLGFIAKMSKAPVVPLAILGTEKAMPIGAKFLTRHKVKIVIEKPVYYESTYKNHDDFAKDVMRKIFSIG